jgi:hypothetical protein
MRELVEKNFPEVGVAYSERHNYPGIHPSQGVGGLGHTVTAHGTPSRHTEGRACDIYFYTWEPQLRAFGDALFDGLAANAGRLGVEDLIYFKRTWSLGHPTIHASDPIDRDNHRDHLHVGFSRAASQHRPMVLAKICEEARAKGLGPLHNSLATRPAGIRGLD